MPETKVFISYASADVAVVGPLAERLESAGIAVWRDQNEIVGGRNYGPEIVTAIKNSSCLLVCCSNASMRSKNVKQEIQLAWHYDVPYLPVILERVSYPEQVLYWMEGWQWIEILDRPQQDWLPQLLKALHSLKDHGSQAAGQPSKQASPLDEIFHSLFSLARLTDQIWPVEHVPPERRRTRLRDLGAPQDDVNHQFALGGRLRLAIETERPGYLLLLDQGTSGTVYCLCPSQFASSQRIEAGLTYLPSPDSKYSSFAVTGCPGREHLLAIISESPLFSEWGATLHKSPARALNSEDIRSLVDRLRSLEADSWTALGTYIEIKNASSGR